MAMTIEQRSARLKLVADGLRRIQEFESARYLDEYAAHLTQPAQAVDVGAIREVIDWLTWQEGVRVDPDNIAEQLTRALAGEKAEGWRTVPIKPTPGMLDAAVYAQEPNMGANRGGSNNVNRLRRRAERIYAAMLKEVS